MMGNVAFGALRGFHRLRLNIDRNGDVGNAVIRQGRSAGEFSDILDMMRAHHPSVVDTYIHVELVELHILLREGVKQVVELETGDGKDGLAVKLGIVEAVEEVDSAR